MSLPGLLYPLSALPTAPWRSARHSVRRASRFPKAGRAVEQSRPRAQRLVLLPRLYAPGLRLAACVRSRSVGDQSQPRRPREVAKIAGAGDEADLVIEAALRDQRVAEPDPAPGCEHAGAKTPARSQYPSLTPSSGTSRRRAATSLGSEGALSNSVSTTGGRQSWRSSRAASMTSTSRPPAARQIGDDRARVRCDHERSSRTRRRSSNSFTRPRSLRRSS